MKSADNITKMDINRAVNTSSAKNGLVYHDMRNHIGLDEEIYDIFSEKCDATNRHSLHVAEYTLCLCKELGMDYLDADRIADAALLHDIGKIVIPSEILLKTDALTDEEYHVMKQHCTYGYVLLTATGDPFLKLAAEIAREHHEHVDGKGYIGLKSDEICFPAKIVAVVDVFDALLTRRCYKEMWSYDKAYNYILEESGKQFEPKVVEAFVRAQDEIKRIYQAIQEEE